MSSLTLIALPVAVIAAIRGVWSPCGLSMLSSITPMTESGRGNTFRGTAMWFTFGGLLGGLSIGLVAAAGAAAVHATGLGFEARVALAGVLAVGTAAIDLGLAGVRLPIFKRQVNDAWLRNYRSWVYGAGFGWQIGFGVATYIMTAAVFLTIGLAVLGASPWGAIGIGLVFGGTRGLAVWIGAPAASPAALARVHERLAGAEPVSRIAAAWVQVLTAGVLTASTLGPAFGVALVATAGASQLLLRVTHPTSRAGALPR